MSSPAPPMQTSRFEPMAVEDIKNFVNTNCYPSSRSFDPLPIFAPRNSSSSIPPRDPIGPPPSEEKSSSSASKKRSLSEKIQDVAIGIISASVDNTRQPPHRCIPPRQRGIQSNWRRILKLPENAYPDPSGLRMRARYLPDIESIDAASSSCLGIRGMSHSVFSVPARRHEHLNMDLSSSPSNDHYHHHHPPHIPTASAIKDPSRPSSRNSVRFDEVGKGLESPAMSSPGPHGGLLADSGNNNIMSEGDDAFDEVRSVLAEWWREAVTERPVDPLGDLSAFLSARQLAAKTSFTPPESPDNSSAMQREREGAQSEGGHSSRASAVPLFEGSEVSSESAQPTLAHTMPLGSSVSGSTASSAAQHSISSAGGTRDRGRDADDDEEDLRALYDRWVDEHGKCLCDGSELEAATEEETLRVQELAGDQSLRRGRTLLLLLKLRAANEAPLEFERFRRAAAKLPKKSLLLPLLVQMQVYQDRRSLAEARHKTISLLLDSLGVVDPLVEAFDQLAASLATGVNEGGKIQGWAEGLDELSRAQDDDVKKTFEGAVKRMQERLFGMRERLERERNVFAARHPAGLNAW